MAEPSDPKDAESADVDEAAGAPDDGVVGSDDVDADELARLPGRPFRAGELDPELMKLSKPHTRIGWLLSLSIVVLCIYVMLQMRADVSFSREDSKPRVVATIDALTRAESDSFVAVRAVPDRAYAARVLKSKSSMGQRLYPVFGTDDRVWLLISGSPWDDKPIYSEVWAGRVRKIADLPFADSLRDYLARSPARPRFFPPERLRQALAEKAARIEHPSGDSIAMTDSTPIVISELVRDRARVTVTRSESYADESQWRAALTRAGLISPETQPESGDGESWTYEVRRTGGVSSVKAALATANLIAETVPVHKDHAVTWGGTSANEISVQAAGESIAWSDVTRVSVSVQRTLPEGATVLVASEHPGDYWFMLPLLAILGAFALLFAWALVRAVRRIMTAGEPASSETADAAA